MARSRNIKPGFFKNENLVELPFETRLLFAGLWTLADREGRLEDRPKKIKMEIFPADNVDVEMGLSDLHRAGMVHRYVVDGKGYIAIPSFLIHQNPHIHEQESVIPAPDLHGASTVVAVPLTSSLIPDSLSSDSLVEAENPLPKTKKQGSRIPDDFSITAEMREYGKTKRPDLDLEIETEKFCNYWRSKPGKDANKLDWLRTWQNWILGAKTNFNGNGHQQHQQGFVKSQPFNEVDFHKELRERRLKKKNGIT